MRQSEALFDCIRRNHVFIVVTLYPSTLKLQKDLERLFDAYEVHYRFLYNERFFKQWTDAPLFDPKEMSDICGGTCMGFWRGHLNRCIVGLCVGFMNKELGTQVPVPEGMDIHDPLLTSEEVMRRLELPVEACAYCAMQTTKKELYEWRQKSNHTTREDVLWHPESQSAASSHE